MKLKNKINELRKIKISFCTTCCNRTWQLKQTLPHNLPIIEKNYMQMCLVNYNSDDDLNEYIKNYDDYVNRGILKYQYTTEPQKFDMAKAKHMSHILGDGEYLYNLDADSFITQEEIDYINSIHDLEAYHNFVREIGNKKRLESHGRIMIRKDIYYKIGGYDCRMIGMCFEDEDMLNKLNLQKYNIHRNNHYYKDPINNIKYNNGNHIRDAVKGYKNKNRIKYRRHNKKLLNENQNNVIRKNMKNTCLIMYYEGTPKRELHELSIRTWSLNKNIDFYILSSSQDIIDYFEDLTKDFENVYIVKYNILNDAREALGEATPLFDEIYDQDPLSLLRGPIRPFSLSNNLSFILDKYKFNGWIDHDVFLSSSFNPDDYFGEDKAEVWFRELIGQLFIINYRLDDYWIELLKDKILNKQQLYGGSKGFLEGTFQNSLRYPKQGKGGVLLIHKMENFKIINNDFYHRHKKRIFITVDRPLYGRFLNRMRRRIRQNQREINII